MKKWVIALSVAVTAASLALRTPIQAQQAVPEIPFDGDINFLKLPPDMNFGEASGVAVNSKGQIAVFTRNNSASGPAYGATASQVLLFDATGKFLKEVGKGLYAWSYAHAIRFDKDDNLWAIDKGSDMIVRINPEGHVTMVFGRKKEASDEAEPWTRVNPPRPPVNGQFRQPTDVAWDTQGNIYISRRLHQLARREIHQGRRLGGLARRAWQGAADSSTRRIASPTTRRATSTLPTAAIAAFR